MKIDGQQGHNDIMRQGDKVREGPSFLTSITEPWLRMSLGTSWGGREGKLAKSALVAAAAIRSFTRTNFVPPPAIGEEPLPDPEDFIYNGPGLAAFNPDGLLLGENGVDFGTVPFGAGGAPAVQHLSLLNYGSEDVVVRRVAVTQGFAQFSVPAIPTTTLRPGESLDIDVTFAPTSTVPIDGFLSIDTDLDGIDGQIALSGVGQPADAPAILVTPFSNLQGIQVGTQEAFPTHSAITNQGTQPLTVTDVRVAAGQGQDEYTVQLIQPLPAVLQPGESYDFVLNFRPSKVGLRPGALEITSNDPQTPVVRTPLVGTGVITQDNYITFEGRNPTKNFVAVEDSNAEVFGQANLPVLRTRSDDAGNWELFLPEKTAIHVATFDPVSGLISHGYALTNAAGQRTELNIGAFKPSVYPDSDGDGLPDDVEFAIGTSPTNPDTDGDGQNDFAEIDTGLNPLDDRPAVTGVVAALKLPDATHDIMLAADPADAKRQLAYLATGGGLTIADVTRFDQPVVLGQLALAGQSQSVTLDPERRLAAISAGAGGLDIVDVSDSTKPVRLLTIGINAGPATFFDGLVYVGVGAEIQAFDPLTGELAETLPLGSNVSGMSRAGSLLWVVTSDAKLEAVDLSGVQMVVVSTLTLPRVGRSLTVADGVAWIAAGTGFADQGTMAVDVSVPNNPVLLSDADRARRLVNAIAPNGSGLAVLAGATAGATGTFVGSAEVVRVDNPAVAPPTFTRFLLPQFGEEVALSSGIAYLADGTGGLQVVNFLAFDQGTTPPTIALGQIAGDLDPGTPGLQFLEASSIVVPARITDDVQVRSVELLLDGAVVRTELSYPYDLSTVLPKIADAGNQVTLQLRATDTGGNVQLSNPIVVDLVPDLTPPAVVSIDPPDGSTEQISRRRVSVQFSEPLDRATAVAANFVLNGPGGIVAPLSFVVRQQGARVELSYPPLAEGDYQFVMHAAAIKDRAGNALASGDVTSTFRIASLTRLPTIRWTADASGFWDDPNNWLDVASQSHRLPTAADDVLIDVPSDAQITVLASAVANSIVSNERFQITGGRLDVDETIQVNNAFLLKGTTSVSPATLSGTVLRGTSGEGITIEGFSRLDAATIQTDVTMDQAGTRLRVAGGLALFGTATVSAGDVAIGFEGDQQVTSGTFTSEGGAHGSATLTLTAIGTATVTFGHDVVIRGNAQISNFAGLFGNTTSVLHWINYGTITAAGAPFNEILTRAESMVNHGLMSADPDTLLTINDATWTNAADGRISVVKPPQSPFPSSNVVQVQLGAGFTTSWTNAGVIELNKTLAYFMRRSDGINETWSNTGTILVDRAEVGLFGRFTSDDLRGVRQTNQINTGIIIEGQMDNTGRVFAPTLETGNFFAAFPFSNAPGGRVIGGTIVNSGPNAQFIVGGILDGVTLVGDFHGEGIVVNGLTLNGTFSLYNRLDGTVNSLFFNGPQTVTGNGTFQFVPAPNFPGGGTPAGIAAFQGGPVVFDSSLTILGTNGGNLTGNIISNAKIVAVTGTGLNLAGLNALNPAFAGSFVNRGPITVPSGATLRLNEPFVNEGTITVNGGTVEAAGRNTSPLTQWRNAGTIDLANQGRLRLGVSSLGGRITNIRTSDLGTILGSGGFVSLESGAVLDNTGSTLVIGGTSDWSLGGQLGGGTILGGTIQVASTAKLNVPFGGTGTLKDVTVEGNVTLRRLQSTLVLVGDLTFHGGVVLEDVTSSSSATIRFGDSTRFPNVSTAIHSGTIDVPGTISSQSSGTLTLDAGVVLRGRNSQAQLAGAVFNHGQIVADRTNPFVFGEVFEFTAAPVTNQGTLAAVNRAVLQIDNLAAPSEGTVSAAAGSTVAFADSFAQTDAATVSVDIAGTDTTQYGHVTVTNAATLAGILNVNFAAGFTPAAGDRFQVIDYGSKTGTFASIQVANLPANLLVTPEYNATNLTLVVSAALQAAGTAAGSSSSRGVISATALDAVMKAAVARWAAVGLEESDLSILRSARVQVEDLPGNVIGASAGSVIRVDRNAAGFGWFVDPTPNDDSEFTQVLAEDVLRSTRRYGVASQRIDLLTTVMHEMGHLIGLPDLDDASGPESLMSNDLAPGYRRLPK